MHELIVMVLVLLIIGLFLIIIGWRIWKKEQITLIHDYHYTRVAEKDKKPYTEKMGKACILMGIGIILLGIIDFVSKSVYGWTCFGIFFVWGLVMMIMAQYKYNGGL